MKKREVQITLVLAVAILLSVSFVSAGIFDWVFGKNVQLSPEEGLVAYYPFEGNALDASGNGNDGIERIRVGYETGKVGQAAEFYREGYIEIERVSGYDPLQGSLSFWVQLDENDADDITNAVLYSDSTYNRFHVRISDGRLLFKNDGTLSQALELQSKRLGWLTGEWHHVTVLWDAPRYGEIYVDGQNVTNVINNRLSGEGQTSHHYIGNFKGNTETGFYMDEVKLYNRVLRECEIFEALGQGACSEPEPDPVACTDSDGGLNYSVKGIVFSSKHVNAQGDVIVSERYGAADECCTDCDYSEDGNEGIYLLEGICDEFGVARFEKYECPNGCLNGVCRDLVGVNETERNSSRANLSWGNYETKLDSFEMHLLKVLDIDHSNPSKNTTYLEEVSTRAIVANLDIGETDYIGESQIKLLSASADDNWANLGARGDSFLLFTNDIGTEVTRDELIVLGAVNSSGNMELYLLELQNIDDSNPFRNDTEFVVIPSQEIIPFDVGETDNYRHAQITLTHASDIYGTARIEFGGNTFQIFSAAHEITLNRGEKFMAGAFDSSGNMELYLLELQNIDDSNPSQNDTSLVEVSTGLLAMNLEIGDTDRYLESEIKLLDASDDNNFATLGARGNTFLVPLNESENILLFRGNQFILGGVEISSQSNGSSGGGSGGSGSGTNNPNAITIFEDYEHFFLTDGSEIRPLKVDRIESATDYSDATVTFEYAYGQNIGEKNCIDRDENDQCTVEGLSFDIVNITAEDEAVGLLPLGNAQLSLSGCLGDECYLSKGYDALNYAFGQDNTFDVSVDFLESDRTTLVVDGEVTDSLSEGQSYTTQNGIVVHVDEISVGGSYEGSRHLDYVKVSFSMQMDERLTILNNACRGDYGRVVQATVLNIGGLCGEPSVSGTVDNNLLLGDDSFVNSQSVFFLGKEYLIVPSLDPSPPALSNLHYEVNGEQFSVTQFPSECMALGDGVCFRAEGVSCFGNGYCSSTFSLELDYYN